MKKLSYLLSLLVILGMAISSCTDDLTDPVPPTVAFIAQEGYISSDVTVEPSAELKFKVNLLEGDAKLDMLEVKVAGQHIENSPYTDISNGDNFELITTVSANEGTYKYDFVLTDKDGESATASVTITVAKVNTVTSYTGVELKAQADGPNSAAANYSFYATSTNTRYVYNDYASNASAIDIVFTHHSLYKTADEVSFQSPGESNLKDMWDLLTAIPSAYNNTIMNTTYLKKVTSTVDWSNLDYDALVSAIGNIGTGTIIRGLAVGDLIAFQTEAGKLGLLKVTALDISNNPYNETTVTFDVKVQE